MGGARAVRVTSQSRGVRGMCYFMTMQNSDRGGRYGAEV